MPPGHRPLLCLLAALPGGLVLAVSGQQLLADRSVKTIAALVLIVGFALIFHEGGHFIIAKLLRMRVAVFSIGVGPKLLSFRRGGTEYRVCSIPLAAYVRIIGMAPEEIDEPDGFYTAPVAGRLAVLLGGSAMNILLAFLVLLLYVSISGLGFRVGVLAVESGTPAERAGLKPNDVFISVEGQPIDDELDLIRLVSPRAGRPTRFLIERGSRRIQVSLIPKAQKVTAQEAATLSDPDSGFVLRANEERGIIGIQPGPVPTRIAAPPMAYVAAALRHTQVAIQGTLGAIALLILEPEAREELRGPVGIVQVTAESAQRGLWRVLELAALLNIWLAIFNLLPIPILDGSKFWIVLIESLRRRIFNKEREAMFHFAGLVFLVFVVLLITAANDIPRLINP